MGYSAEEKYVCIKSLTIRIVAGSSIANHCRQQYNMSLYNNSFSRAYDFLFVELAGK